MSAQPTRQQSASRRRASEGRIATGWAAGAAVLLLAGGSLSCHQALFTAPPGSSLKLYANPTSIPAYGGVSIITAIVTEPAGTPVSDGTVVQFFTDLGRIDEQGKTNDGVARVNLVSDSRSGTATVVAVSGGEAVAAPTVSPTASPTQSAPVTAPAEAAALTAAGATDSVQVKIGVVNVTRVRVAADPPRLVGKRTAEITATVYDDAGNPVARIPVTFKVTEGTSTSDPARFEVLTSGGDPVFTDNNGRAYDTLGTRYDPASPPRSVTVTAETSNQVSGSVLVDIN
jgi:hypothetical protein